MNTIAIHQPNFLPWMGFFKKMEMADQFVYLDHVSFSKGSYTNRVQYFCKSSQKTKWLTLPVQKSPIGTRISDIKLEDRKSWDDKITKTIHQNIDSSIAELIIDTIRNRRTESLVDLNISLIAHLLRYFEISTPVVRSSQMEIVLEGDQEVLAICKNLGAEKYVSGKGGASYLDLEAFAQNEIEVELCDFMGMMKGEGEYDKERIGMTAVYFT